MTVTGLMSIPAASIESASSRMLFSVRPASADVRGWLGLGLMDAMSISRRSGMSGDNPRCLLRAIEDQLSKRLVEGNGKGIGTHLTRGQLLIDFVVEDSTASDWFEDTGADRRGELLHLRQVPAIICVLRIEACRQDPENLQVGIKAHANVAHDLQQADDAVRCEAIGCHGDEDTIRRDQCVD